MNPKYCFFLQPNKRTIKDTGPKTEVSKQKMRPTTCNIKIINNVI